LEVARLTATLSDKCCQVAEIPAKKLKRGREKKIWPEELVAEFLAEFYRKWQKRDRNSLFYSTQRQTQNLIFISIGPRVERCIDV
jgi:hypothetical protein